MSILDRAIAHFEATAGTVVEVPEWGTGDAPLRVLVRPLTMSQKRFILKVTGDDRTGVEATLRAIIRACVDADTLEPLFSEKDLQALRTKVHPAIINRLGKAIDDLDAIGDETVREAEGN